MGKANTIEAPIRDKNTITVPKEIRDILGAKEGDILVFKKEKNHILVGLIKRTIIEEEPKYMIEEEMQAKL